MEDDEQEELERVREWIGQQEALSRRLTTSTGDSATDFANNTLQAMQAVVMPHVVPAQTPAMLLALEAVSAATRATTIVIMGLGGHA